MKENIIATYERPSSYDGLHRFHGANRYHEFCKLDCVAIDNTKAREKGIMINGKPIPDYFDIVVYNGLGDCIHRYHHTNPAEADMKVKDLLIKYGDFTRMG